MTRDDVNKFCCALLETLDADGIPESFAVIAGERLGLSWGEMTGAVLPRLIQGGLLARVDGPKLVPGPQWARVKAGLAAHRGA